jgi:methyl-accepting chemotaxis protein
VPWFYSHRVPAESFYSLVKEQQNYALWTTLIAAIVAVGAVIWFSNVILKRPLSQLLEGAKAIERGDLERRLSIGSQDEIGEVAGSFNTMADSLAVRIESEQQAQAEAQRLHQAEAANRQFLEESVASYLKFVQQVAQGDLTRRLTVQHNGSDYHGGSSLEKLGNELNTMVERLHNITGQVQEASNSIAAAATEILSATTQQASSASEQSSAVTQTSTTVEQVKSIAHELSQQAAQAAQDSQSALQKARQGMQTVEETVTGMDQIRSRVESIAQTILVLSEQTKAIGTITTTVSELADQSNLLALNAAIEAARAGEQGKSFAVVAQQVRELAERSKHATEQVQDILQEIQRATNAAVMVTEEGTRGVESGTRLAGEAGQMIHEIAEEVEAEAQTNLHMAEAAHQQTVGMGQVGQAILSIQQATNQSLASTRQAERAAQDMHNLARMLQQAVAVYRLN